MLAVQAYLLRGNTFEDLNKDFGINVNYNKEDTRVILNYDQIESYKHRFNPIVRECRGLVLDKISKSLITRGFYRFFNWGEYPEEQNQFNWTNCTATHKEDGSYIVLYYWNNRWRLNTRNSFGDGLINNISWKQIFNEASNPNFLFELDHNLQYVFELCSPYNPVVRRYTTPTLFLLNVFSGYYEVADWIIDEIAIKLNIQRPKSISLDGVDSAIKYIENVSINDKTFEGLVLKDNHNYRFKIKNPEYLRLHKLNNNGNLCTISSLFKFVLNGEKDELLTYFPHVKKQYEQIELMLNQLLANLDNLWFVFQTIESRKKFAEKVIKCPLSSILFIAHDKKWKQGIDVDIIKLAKEQYADKLLKVIEGKI